MSALYNSLDQNQRGINTTIYFAGDVYDEKAVLLVTKMSFICIQISSSLSYVTGMCTVFLTQKLSLQLKM